MEDGRAAPILSIGFRPFFLLATSSALVLVPLWLWVLTHAGVSPYWTGTAWHSHEMIFGFTTAVVAGFLLTAASNWAQRRTASGSLLFGLAALWCAGRLVPLLPLWPELVAAVDLAFLPALWAVLGRALFAARSRRNYGLLALLAALFLANGAMHAEQLHLHGFHVPLMAGPAAGQRWALWVVAGMVLVVGGRVIPMFTRNATGRPEVRKVAALDGAALVSFFVAVGADVLGVATTIGAMLWLAASALHLARMLTWGSRHARAPLLWVLHVGYAATAASFALEGLSQLGYVPSTAALHLFTVGGIGLLTSGMMARVSLGHSGRHLVVPRSVAVAFGLLTLAAAVRVFVPWYSPAAASLGWMLSGALWASAFALLLHFGVPIWFSPRADQGGRA